MMYLATQTGNATIYSTAMISMSSIPGFCKDYFAVVTKSLHQGNRPAEHFDSFDTQTEVDIDMSSLTLFLELFHKYLLTSDYTWDRTSSIMDKPSLLRLVVFLKNILLNTFIQGQQNDLRSTHFDLMFSVGVEVMGILNEINDEHPFVDKKYFMAREDQLATLQTLFEMVDHMNEEQINYQIKILKKLPFCFPFDTKYYLFSTIIKTLRGQHLEESVGSN